MLFLLGYHIVIQHLSKSSLLDLENNENDRSVSPFHSLDDPQMDYMAAFVRRKCSNSDSESQENLKKFAASLDSSYSPPPAAKSKVKID